VVLAGDVGSSEQHCGIVDRAISELGGIDIQLNNAAHQANLESRHEIVDEGWELTFMGEHPRDVLSDQSACPAHAEA
jgi:NAD(P)-dependent dehydrogenase (short-subunit alcohol dehydrogenase family)